MCSAMTVVSSRRKIEEKRISDLNFEIRTLAILIVRLRFKVERALTQGYRHLRSQYPCCRVAMRAVAVGSRLNEDFSELAFLEPCRLEQPKDRCAFEDLVWAT